MERLLELLQLGDSSFPIGGYAYSYGLEAAFQTDQISNSQDLIQYLHLFMRNQSTGELPFLEYENNFPTEDGYDFYLHRIRYYDALITSEGMYQSSLSLGKNWARIYLQLYNNSEFKKILRNLDTNNIPKHYTPLLGFSLSLQGFTPQEIKIFYLFQSLRDQISSAIRLGIIGPMQGVSIQKQLQDNSKKYLSLSENLNFEDAYREFPALEFSQNIHQHLYSNIFQC